MRVIATAVGFDGTELRNPGDEFEMPDGAKGSWFEPKDDEPKAEAKPHKSKAKSEESLA